MPQNFPEIWENRVIQNLKSNDEAPWLEGVSELSASVQVINEGAASEQNKIYVAETDFDVDVLINNSTYPIPVQKYEDGTIEITLDKLQTKVTTLSDDQCIGASYNKIDAVTKGHTRSIKVSKYMKAIHAIAPAVHTAKTPVLTVAGERMTYDDLVALKSACDKAGFGGKGFTRRLVLCNKHWNEMLLDRERFANMLISQTNGTVSAKILGFEIFEYEGMPVYAVNGKKQPYGVKSLETDREASVVFVKERIAKKTGLTKQYFAPAKFDPEQQTNRLSYRHYFIATPFQNQKIGAIIDKA